MAKPWKDQPGGSEEVESIPASIFDEKKRIRPEITANSMCDANDRNAFEIALGSVELVSFYKSKIVRNQPCFMRR